MQEMARARARIGRRGWVVVVDMSRPPQDPGGRLVRPQSRAAPPCCGSVVVPGGADPGDSQDSSADQLGDVVVPRPRPGRAPSRWSASARGERAPTPFLRRHGAHVSKRPSWGCEWCGHAGTVRATPCTRPKTPAEPAPRQLRDTRGCLITRGGACRELGSMSAGRAALMAQSDPVVRPAVRIGTDQTAGPQQYPNNRESDSDEHQDG